MNRDIKEAARHRILFPPHAVQQMSRPERMISAAEVRDVVHNGTVIEEYPEDIRGRSCLLMRFVNDRCLHVVCAPKSDYLAIITAYIPDNNQWEADFKTRKS
jgi:hypothetical protein